MKLLKNKLAVTIIVLSVIFLILIGYSVERKKASFAESSIGSVINSIQGKFYNATSNSKSFFEFFAHYNEVKTENEDLKKQINELENMKEHYDTLKSDNKNLREMLNFEKNRIDYEYKGADIISRVGGDWIDSLGVNVGLNNGIEVGMVAVDNYGCLVGRVTKVASDWSVIETLANSNIAVSGVVGGSPNDNGIVKGFKGINNSVLAILNFIPQSSTIKNGDIIVTLGLDQSYPKDIRIGTVIDVQEDKGKLAKSATIQPFVNFNKLQELAIIIPKNKRDIKY